MFNREIEASEENKDILFANAIIENLRYGIISLDIMFNKKASEDFYYDEHTFYFFYIQSLLTAQGNIWNVLFNDFFEKREIIRERKTKLKLKFGIDIKDFPLVGNKNFRNTNEHFDERYDQFKYALGDLNIINATTDYNVRKTILEDAPHLRTIDIENWKYITYDRHGNRITLDLKQLRDEMYTLLQQLCTYDIRKS